MLEVHSSTVIIPVAILGTCWVHLIQPKIWRCLRWLWNHPNILFGKRLFEATNLWYLMVHISEVPNSPWLPYHLLIPVTIPQINSAQTLGLAHVQTLWKIPLKRSDASLWSECFLQQVHFFYKMVEPGRASHWSRSCLILLLCQKWTLLHMQCPFHNIFS